MTFEDLMPRTLGYWVKTKTSDNFVIKADKAVIDTENKMVKFLNGDSVQAMFLLDDVKAFWRQ